jgi:hypothetical protein
MAGPFAIAAVTAVLKDLLNDGLANHDLSALGNVLVTALPPDRIPVTNADEQSQLNLFMYQVTPNSGWRNVALPSRGANGERLSNPPLALDLRYLLTAYGKEQLHAEALLGYAMQLLHEHPVLTREAINATLKPSLPAGVTLPSGIGLVAVSDLAEQVELVKISQTHVDAEEMSRLWSAMQAKYRPSAVYHLSVVLIEGNAAAKAPLPVLAQGEGDRGPRALAGTVPPLPTITGVALPNNRLQALLGDAVTVTGHHFVGESGSPADVTVSVRLASARLGEEVLVPVPVPLGARDDRRLVFTVPATPSALPAGLYALSVGVTPTAPGSDTRFSNEIPFAIAPQITGGLGAPLARTAVDGVTGLGTATIALTIAPELRPSQRATLVVGSKEVLAEAHPAQTAAVTFIARAMAAGTYRLRLRVDGAESPLVDRSDPARPMFDESQVLELT